MELPSEVDRLLKTASTTRTANRRFVCEVFGGAWDGFVETWAPVIYDFVGAALGPYGTHPLPTILPLHDGMHMAGATASFDMVSGQVRLATSVAGNAGQTLEKLTHEFIHGSLSQFPEGDPFYEEGQVDFATWTLAHAPVWGEHRQGMIDAAAFNISNRRERAFKTGTDYDRKRWAGGLHCSMAYGPSIIVRLRQKKLAGDFSW